jgi:hypothetical protein
MYDLPPLSSDLPATCFQNVPPSGGGPNSLLSFAALKNLEDHHDQGDNQENVNDPTQRVPTEQAQHPQNQKNDSYGPQHEILLFDRSFSLPAIASPNPTHRQWKYILLGLGIGLLDDHLVLYALHTVYVVDVFGGQVLFHCGFGLAT